MSKSIETIKDELLTNLLLLEDSQEASIKTLLDLINEKKLEEFLAHTEDALLQILP